MARKAPIKKAAAPKRTRKPKAEERATPENPSFNLSDPEMWDGLLNGGPTDSGVAMNKPRALTYAPVWQAVSLISGDCAKLPLELYQTDIVNDRLIRSEMRTHPVYQLVAKRPNRELPAFSFWRRVMLHLLLWNRAFVFIDRDSAGRPVELFNLLPDRVAPERLNKREMLEGGVSPERAEMLDGQLVYVVEADGRLKTLYPSEVLDFQGIAFDTIERCDLVEKARNSWALGLAQEKFGSKFFSNGARVSGILEVPAGMQPKAKDRLEEGFTKAHTGQDNWFKVVILRDGAKFHQTSISPNDGQMNESREHQVRDVCRWFNLAPSKLGLSDSVSYNSKTEDNQSYYDSTLSPWLNTITSECWFKLLSTAEQVDHFFEHDTDQLLRLDTFKRFQVYEIGRRIGIWSPNDVLALENFPPRPGGDVYQDVLQGAGQKEKEGDSDERAKMVRSLDRVLWEVGRRAETKSDNSAAFGQWMASGFDGMVDMASELLDGRRDVAERFLEQIWAEFGRISRDSTPKQLRFSVSRAVKKLEERSISQWIDEHFSRN